MKTKELNGGMLDYWVAKAEDRAVDYHDLGAHGGDFVTVVDPEQSGWVFWSPSRAWADGGPIISRENIATEKIGPIIWAATIGHQEKTRQLGNAYEHGETLLIAAMRAYVASKFGDEVAEIP
jgi:hypothetical protein